jgi:outer membrane protein assembly factor BamB
MLGILAALCVMALGADWPQFRGPAGMGLGRDGNLPVEFNRDKNVAWKAAVPPGHSSPVFFGSRIFLTAVDGDALVTLCLDRASGKVQWRREAPRPRKEHFQKTNGPASPTPATDGKRVYVFFGDYGLIAYGVDGDEKWKVPLGPFNNANGHGSSPVVFDDLVVLLCDQDTGSYLLAVDARTGKQRWRVERPEVTRGYATPAVYQPKPGAVKELIVPGAYQLISYNLKTGEKLWWANGMAWQLKCVPVIEDGVIYINSWETGGDFENAPAVETWAELKAKYDKNNDDKVTPDEAPAEMQRWYQNNDLNFNKAIEERDWAFWILHRTAQNSVLAIKPDGGRGDLTSKITWRYRKSLPNVPSPLLYQGTLFLIKDGGILTTLDPKTGAVHKQGRLTGAIEQYWASPVGGDGKVFLVSQACKVTVVKAQAEWEIEQMNDLEDECFATPALVDGGLYLRTKTALYFFKHAR